MASESEVEQMFRDAEDEFLEFERIRDSDKRDPSNDVCAFIYLREKCGSDHPRIAGSERAISGAEHDVITLGGDLSKLTKADVIYLARCGVSYNHDEYGGLYMFV